MINSQCKHLLIKVLQYSRSLIIILLCLYCGELIGEYFEAPSSILGLLILFAALSLKIIPLNWVDPVGNLLLKFILVLFVPIGVGLLEHLDLLASFWVEILLCSLFSTCIVIVAVGYFGQRSMR